MTYLAHITFRIPEKLLFIPLHVYRDGTLLVEADSTKEANDKVKKVKNYYYHYLTKPL